MLALILHHGEEQVSRVWDTFLSIALGNIWSRGIDHLDIPKDATFSYLIGINHLWSKGTPSISSHISPIVDH